MKRMPLLIAMSSLLFLAACGKEETVKTDKEQAEQTKTQKEENQGVATETKGTAEEEKEILWKTDTLELTKAGVPLYGNESGGMEFTGYTTDEEGKMIAVIGYTGEMVKANRAEKKFRVVLDNGNAFEIGDTELDEIRVVGDKEYHIYRSSTTQHGEVVRVDMSLVEFSQNTFDEEENTVIKTKITPSKDVFELTGTQMFDVRDDEKIERENNEMRIELGGVQSEYTEEGLLIYGDITFKKDLEETPVFSYAQPEMGAYETKELELDTNTNVYYEGATVSFAENIKFDYPMAKDNIHTLYFTIGNEVFAIDLNTGKELDEIDAMHLFYKDDKIKSYLPLEGHLDAEGNRFYDTYINEGFFTYANTTDPGTKSERIAVGGYGELTFKVGAKKNQPVPHAYELRVFADDFDASTKTGTIIYETEIKHDSPMTEHSIDVSEYEKVYVLVNSKLANQEAEEKLFAYLYADAFLRK